MDRLAGAVLSTLLFVPGSDRDKLDKAGRFGSDAIVVDLEDAVAEDEKRAARDLARAAVASYGDGPAAMVRVNGVPGGRMTGDVAAVVQPRLDAVLLPKVEDAGELAAADAALADAERDARLPAGAIRLIR